MREFFETLRRTGEVRVISGKTDVRKMQALLAAEKGPVWFEEISGYPGTSAVGGVFTSREMVAKVLHCSPRKIAQGFDALTQTVVKPQIAEGPAPVKEVIERDGDVDLARLPIPVMHVGDGGPYIACGIVAADDPDGELGTNLGMYRLMYRTKNETGIDLVTASDLRTFYQRALEKGKPLPISVVIGASPACMIAATYKAPIGVCEYDIAGSIQGRPLKLVKSETNGIYVPADAEYVLEGELLPIGWTEQEGPFGEFAGFQGESKWNPIFRVRCVTRRKNPIYYSLLMPDENDWLVAAGTEKSVYNALRNAGVDVHEVCVTPGSACFWKVIASIRKRTGEGVNAMLAALSVSCIKTAVITDADVDIFDPCEVDRAMTFRVRPDRDVLIVGGARGNHVDPSLEAWTLPRGQLPVTSKLGIDATKPDSIPWERYGRIRCYEGAVEESPLPAGDGAVEREMESILADQAMPFTQIVDALGGYGYPDILAGWGRLRASGRVERNPDGTYFLKGRNG